MSAWDDTSEQIDAVSAAFVKALGEMTDIVKTETANAGQYAYKYATLADAFQMIRPIMARHGVAITQTAEATYDEVIIWTTILHESGQFLTTKPLRLPAGKTAQQTGSALSYGKRYALMAACGLATEDDDGASAGPREARNRPEERTAPASTPKPSRSREEEQIRAILSDLPPSTAKQIRDEFRTQFGATLASLPTDEHPTALGWVTARALEMTEPGESL